MKFISMFIIFLCFTITLYGCGQAGNLYLPKQDSSSTLGTSS